MIEQLKNRLALPLPGKAAQLEMASISRMSNIPPPDNARIACVMALFYPKAADWHLVLIERMSSHKGDRHSGQISFPGGGLEPQDPSLKAGALRETQEEVGVIREDIEVLGRLTELYIPVSNFLVHPFVGKIDYAPTFIPQETEVKSIIETPLNLLKNPATIKRKDLTVRQGITLRDVPYYDVNEHTVWGATAMMLSELLTVIEEAH